jgi:hypothetical protein
MKRAWLTMFVLVIGLGASVYGFGTKTNGEPTDIGRKSRLWTNAMTRAIKDRDQHCQFYGCTQTHNLQIHHIIHWANGGSTSVENGVCLCQYHHTLVHEGGYSIQAVANNQTSLNEQFSQQQHASETSMFDFEKELRNNRESFNKVRKLSPTTYRFRVFDADGRDISASDHAETCKNDIPSMRDSQIALNPANHYELGPNHSTQWDGLLLTLCCEAASSASMRQNGSWKTPFVMRRSP